MKKYLFRNVTIIGVGLIGGSLGLAIKKRKLARLVVGVARRPESAKAAVRCGAVDVATVDLREGVRGADLVILCAPVSTIIRQMKELSKLIGPGTLVIDVGSSKSKIESAARKYFNVGAPRVGARRRAGTSPAPTFVGCHPMAGSEKCGVEFADADLFEGAQCFVTNSNTRVNRFWKALGANPILISAKQHDAWVARFSYLPHLLAFSLFQKKGLGKFSDSKLKASNPSVCELARLAASNAGLWSDILVSNKMTIQALMDFEDNLCHLKRMLRSNDAKGLQRFIQVSNRLSKQFVPC